MYEELFPDAVQILDFYHFSENAYGYAKALYPENEVLRKGWVNKLIKFIEDAVRSVKESALSNLPNGIVNFQLIF